MRPPPLLTGGDRGGAYLIKKNFFGPTPGTPTNHPGWSLFFPINPAKLKKKRGGPVEVFNGGLLRGGTGVKKKTWGFLEKKILFFLTVFFIFGIKKKPKKNFFFQIKPFFFQKFSNWGQLKTLILQNFFKAFYKRYFKKIFFQGKKVIF